MIQHQSRYTSQWARPVALLLVGSMTLPTLAGCGSQQASNPAPLDATQGQAPMRPPGMGQQPGRMGQQKPGMSTGQKRMIALAGAAALYYMYKKRQARPQNQQNVQYYLSKNGRIYYRDPKNPRQEIYVTAPRQAFQVPESEAAEYQRFQGYDNRTSGLSDFKGLIDTQ